MSAQNDPLWLRTPRTRKFYFSLTSHRHTNVPNNIINTQCFKYTDTCILKSGNLSKLMIVTSTRPPPSVRTLRVTTSEITTPIFFFFRKIHRHTLCVYTALMRNRDLCRFDDDTPEKKSNRNYLLGNNSSNGIRTHCVSTVNWILEPVDPRSTVKLLDETRCLIRSFSMCRLRFRRLVLCTNWRLSLIIGSYETSIAWFFVYVNRPPRNGDVPGRT